MHLKNDILILVYSHSWTILLKKRSPPAEFWKFIPPTEPYRVLLSEVRDKLYYTREHFQAQLEGRQSYTDEADLVLRTDDVSKGQAWGAQFKADCRAVYRRLLDSLDRALRHDKNARIYRCDF